MYKQVDHEAHTVVDLLFCATLVPLP